MVKRDVQDFVPHKTDPHNTGSRNTGPRNTDPRNSETMTVSKSLGSVPSINDFIDPHLNGRWVFSNQGFNNRVADLRFGNPDEPFIGYEIGGGDNQRVSKFDLPFLNCIQDDVFKVFLHPKCRLL